MRTINFYVPSGYQYEIREQNGEDEEILSNPKDMRDLMNFTKFIQAIVVKTNFTSNGRLTIQDALNIPVNDRYCILFQSRIFSLGDTVEFSYDWDNGKVDYEQEVSDLLFDDYSEEKRSSLTEEDLNAKPDAIPYYPEGKKFDFEYTLESGKRIRFHLLDGNGERRLITLPKEKQTRNSPLLCRDLELYVDGKWEKVQNFSIFTVRETHEIRKRVMEVDPTFEGAVDIENPETGEKTRFPIITAPGFFFLTE